MDGVVAAVAARQAGAVARDQVYEAGGDDDLLARRVAAGRLLARPADVFVVAGTPDTAEQRRWVAQLGGGPRSHLSHEAAAELDGVDGIRRGLVVVTVPHGHHVAPAADRVHQLDDVQPHHLRVVRGLRATTPERTILDLAAVVGPVRLATAVEDTVVRRLCTFTEIAGVLRDVRRRGKPGVRRLAAVLDAREGLPPPASALERLLLEAARLAGVHAVRQHPLPWAQEPTEGVVDAAVPESRLILEADGRRWHARLQAMAKDRRRDVEAARAGWLTLRFVYEDLADVAAVAAAIAQVHASRVSRPRNARA